MNITILGTSSMVPTKDRNHVSTLVEYKQHGLLFDCGEGTQRQLKLADIRPPKIDKIFLTHWHGDHVFGLPGLMQTLASSDYDKTLEIYGPAGTRQRIATMNNEVFLLDKMLAYEVIEIPAAGGILCETPDFSVMALPLEHSIPCFGYAFVEKDTRNITIAKAKRMGLSEGPLLGKLQRGETITLGKKTIRPDEVSRVKKGKKIAVVLDTALSKNCYVLAYHADVLICEATYASGLQEKAEEYGHLTARQAGEIAAASNAKKLILTHYSQRNKTTDELLDEARLVFQNTVAGFDLMKIHL
ncbi:ribonuclease Z [Candidatus Woesearchaeota archaeon CG_4_10_14_0_8_um_filter_47_5]|nr:MAG: ribonuclease Z [Candidatus Woesearchaeota archaeon CG_4_10_14_0_8_um_filter_47_5]